MKNLLYLLPLILLSGCSGSSDDSSNSMDTLTVDSVNQEMAIYTIPSPLFIGTALKESGCEYSPALVEDQKTYVLPGTGKMMIQSMRLGMYITDFGYAFMNDQQPDMNAFLAKAEELIHLLDMQSPAVNAVMVRLKNNLHNRDSVKTLIQNFQGKISQYYLENNNNIISIYILTGMMAEGLHLSLGSCSGDQEPNMNFLSQPMHQLLLQQKAFQMNLSDMMKGTGVQTDPDLARWLSGLATAFSDLKMNYSVDRKKNRIRFVYFDKTKMPALKKTVSGFRQWIRES